MAQKLLRTRLREYEVHLDEVPETRPGKEAGIGAFGVVLKSKLNGAHCAVKRLHKILLGAGDYEAVDEFSKRKLLQEFVAEIKLLKKQRHPNIVQFLGVCTLDRQPDSIALVMELMEASIKDLISTDSAYCCKGTLSLGMKISILKDAACGMSHLHSQDIIHSDLNAGNVLLTSSLQAKIADLGISCVFPPQSMNLPAMSTAPGAAEFMPPEACIADPVYGLTLDCFSFGHLALLLLIEDYPQLNDYGVDDITYNQAIRENQREIWRRRNSFTVLEDHHDQRILHLLKSCLNDKPSLRPSMKEIRETLDDLLTTMDYEPPSLVKLQQQARQLQLLQEQIEALKKVREQPSIDKIPTVIPATRRQRHQSPTLTPPPAPSKKVALNLQQPSPSSPPPYEAKLLRRRANTGKGCTTGPPTPPPKPKTPTVIPPTRRQSYPSPTKTPPPAPSEAKLPRRRLRRANTGKGCTTGPPTPPPKPKKASFYKNISEPSNSTENLEKKHVSLFGKPEQEKVVLRKRSQPSPSSPPPNEDILPNRRAIEEGCTTSPPTPPPKPMRTNKTPNVIPTTRRPSYQSPPFPAPPEQQKVVLKKSQQPSPSSPPPNEAIFSNIRRAINTVGGCTAGPPTPPPKPMRTNKISAPPNNSNKKQPDWILLQGKGFKSRWMQNAQETPQSKDAEEELRRKRQLEIQKLMQARREEHDKDNDA